MAPPSRTRVYLMAMKLVSFQLGLSIMRPTRRVRCASCETISHIARGRVAVISIPRHNQRLAVHVMPLDPSWGNQTESLFGR
ncbi:MAG: hypothetical protein EPN74_09930 [Rhodanobacter sp.]|nr:MAG: hypothetical protein EPN74_09930 [Rhodanobacter sp.]